KEYDLGEGSVLILFVFCCALLYDDVETLPLSSLRPILGQGETRQIERRFKSREHKLLKRGLIENDCHDGMADTKYFRFTEKSKNEFLADVDIKEKSRHHSKDFIFAETLAAKKLFYSEKITRRIAELTSLLCEENFKNIQKRLEENNMHTGFACLFSGPPGTGKTETVYQIARETGRDIMMVDIAETKSMWFGESEKRIKAVFDHYRGAVKSGGRTPILLFNEADAVLGKRRELGASRNGPEQTENSIQNIILQEMEDLSGILIATTNMTGNLDKAFERRFLYKIEFEKPDIMAKKAIWQNIIPTLSGDDALTLSKNFDFSGGQIENIARRQMVCAILTGVTPMLCDIITLCREEMLEKEDMKRIGFRVE
ncbi:MAG: AAA family ATPase, partial [Treponema sp.]|nr:AAA family ATPase [Treponema sp.]